MDVNPYSIGRGHVREPLGSSQPRPGSQDPGRRVRRVSPPRQAAPRSGEAARAPPSYGKGNPAAGQMQEGATRPAMLERPQNPPGRAEGDWRRAYDRSASTVLAPEAVPAREAPRTRRPPEPSCPAPVPPASPPRPQPAPEPAHVPAPVAEAAAPAPAPVAAEAARLLPSRASQDVPAEQRVRPRVEAVPVTPGEPPLLELEPVNLFQIFSLDSTVSFSPPVRGQGLPADQRTPYDTKSLGIGHFQLMQPPIKGREPEVSTIKWALFQWMRSVFDKVTKNNPDTPVATVFNVLFKRYFQGILTFAFPIKLANGWYAVAGTLLPGGWLTLGLSGDSWCWAYSQCEPFSWYGKYETLPIGVRFTEFFDLHWLHAWITGQDVRQLTSQGNTPQILMFLTPVLHSFEAMPAHTAPFDWRSSVPNYDFRGFSPSGDGPFVEFISCLPQGEFISASPFGYPERGFSVTPAKIAVVSLLFGAPPHGCADASYLAQALALGASLEPPHFPLGKDVCDRVLLTTPDVYTQMDGEARRTLRRFWTLIVMVPHVAHESWYTHTTTDPLTKKRSVFVCEPSQSPMLRLHCLALKQYRRILYVELDIVNCIPLHEQYFSSIKTPASIVPPVEGASHRAKAKEVLELLFSANSDAKVPAFTVSRKDFSFFKPFAPIVSHDTAHKNWGSLLNGGVMLLEPSEDLWKVARSVMSSAFSWPMGGLKGGNDVAAMALVFRHQIYALPPRFNAITPRIVEPSDYRGIAWEAWEAEGFFPFFAHLVGALHFQDNFAPPPPQRHQPPPRTTDFIRKITEAFHAWFAVQQAAGCPCPSKDLFFEMQRDHVGGLFEYELGYFGAPKNTLDKPKLGSVFSWQLRRLNPFAKLSMILWHACHQIHELHRLQGGNDPTLASTLENGFPHLCSIERDRITGETFFFIPFRTQCDSSGRMLCDIGPPQSSLAGRPICMPFQQSRCRLPTEFVGFEGSLKKCTRGLHVCGCYACLLSSDFNHAIRRGTCEKKYKI